MNGDVAGLAEVQEDEEYQVEVVLKVEEEGEVER